MQNKKKKSKKIQNLLVFSGFSAIILIVSTYAWFIGRQEVRVNQFEVEIAATEFLSLSLNGTHWNDIITLAGSETDPKTWPLIDDLASDESSQIVKASASYTDHTNSWGTGLKPVSSSGNVDYESSRMEIFEKASFAKNPSGGYRLLANQVDNGLDATDTLMSEAGGYVAFDLFVKNFGGDQYITGYNPLDEDEIFLTVDSAVVADATGEAAQIASGIENSIRVAFVPIGRVSGDSDPDYAYGDISCGLFDGTGDATTRYDATSGVTSICGRTTVWEPNELAHNQDTQFWFAENCRTRIAADVMDSASYTDVACTNPFEDVDGNAIATPTYAVNSEINDYAVDGDNADIYDGYNTYTPSSKVTLVDTFTDTEKKVQGDARLPFMYLSPNSITKIRVYIYLEGNDFDSHDLANVLGSQVTINFGFTKMQYETPADNDGTIDPDFGN